MDGIKVLAFDTGGTILDWHSGIVQLLAETGARRGVAARIAQAKFADPSFTTGTPLSHNGAWPSTC
jgi:hypothetical protein